MRRWGTLFAYMLLLPTAAFAAEMIDLPEQARRAAAELNWPLPAQVPADLDLQAKTVRPAMPAPEKMAPWPTQDWAASSPEAQGMDTPALTEAFRYAFQRGAKGVVVIRNGYLVAEYYAPEWNAGTRQQAYSVSKSFTSGVVGMLIDDGVIDGVGQPVADFVPRWDDPQHGAVTVGNLLSMNSGLEYGLLTDALLLVANDQNAYAMGLPMQHTPGTNWTYHNAACQMPSEVILQATGMQTGQLAADRLGREIGMWTTTWQSDGAGNTLTYMGVVSTPRELAKYGYLFLRRGEWDGRQLISAAYVDEATSPSQALNPFYGYLWWLNTGGLALPDVPADAYAALGFQEKRIYVVPSQDLVAVRLGDANGAWDDNNFLGLVCASVTGKGSDLAAKSAPKAGLTLRGNHPNPFNPRTEIAFALGEASPVRLTVYDAAGRLVRTLQAGETLASGEHRTAWDGRDASGRAAATGVYFYRLESGRDAVTGKMVLVE